MLVLEEVALPNRRTYASLLSFVLPVAALFLILASGINAPLILLLYIVIVFEGAGLFLWILSKIMADEGMPGSYPATPYKSYLFDRNRAENLFNYMKSAKKSSVDSRRYSRMEIARVLRGIVDKDTEKSPELEFVLNSTGEKDKLDYFSALDRVLSKLESE